MLITQVLRKLGKGIWKASTRKSGSVWSLLELTVRWQAFLKGAWYLKGVSHNFVLGKRWFNAESIYKSSLKFYLIRLIIHVRMYIVFEHFYCIFGNMLNLRWDKKNSWRWWHSVCLCWKAHLLSNMISWI